MKNKKELQEAIDSVQKKNKKLDENFRILESIILAMQQSIKTKIGNTCKDDISAVQKKNKSYSFIPYMTRYALDQLKFAYNYLPYNKTNYKDYSFIDAGCGIGNILLLADRIGFTKLRGLEIDPTTIRYSICPKSFIKKQNVLTYKSYGQYDVIYYFCPIEDFKKEIKFEQIVENQMKLGAILIANSKADQNIKENKKFKRISENYSIYEKIAN